jgi:hypothetical protein
MTAIQVFMLLAIMRKVRNIDYFRIIKYLNTGCSDV